MCLFGPDAVVRRRGLSAVWVLLLCAGPTVRTAASQEPDSVVLPAHYLSEVRVTVSRLGASGVPLARLPYSAQVLEVDSAPDRGGATAADLLAGMPGVSFGDQFGSAFQPDLRFRGFQVGPVVGYAQSVSVFVDGVRVNEPDASQVNFHLIPLRAVERVEVIRTPGGPFGRNTLAGAINLVTRSGAGDGRLSGDLEVGAGAFGRREASGWAGGGGGRFHYLFSGRAYRDDGWRDLNEARLGQGFVKLGWGGPRTDAWISYTHARDRIQAPGSLPASWLAGELPPELAGVEDPRRLQFTGFAGDWFAPVLDFAVVHVRHALPRGPIAVVNGFARWNRFTQFNDNITEPNVRGETDIASGGVTAQLEWAGPGGLATTGGAEYVRNRVGIRIFEEPNPAFPAAGGMTEDVSTRDDNVSAFAHLWWPVAEALGVTASVRYDYIHLPITDRLDPEHSGVNRFSEPSGSMGIDWSPFAGVRTFASYGRGFRAPVILEITCADPEDPCPLPFELGADPPLDPVTTDTWQAGARWTPLPAVHLELVAYRAEVHDDLFPVVAVPATRGYFKNIDRTRRQGAELTGRAALGRGLSIRGALALTRATFESEATLASAFIDDDDDDEATESGPAAAGRSEESPSAGPETGVRVAPGDRFAMVPGLTWDAGIDYASAAWSAGLAASFVGEQYFSGDEANERRHGVLGSRFLMSGSAERRHGGLRLFLRGENLLDARYHTFGLISPNVRGPDTSAQPFLSPGLPRRVSLGLGYRF